MQAGVGAAKGCKMSREGAYLARKRVIHSLRGKNEKMFVLHYILATFIKTRSCLGARFAFYKKRWV